jgi:hypothetical protein
VERLAARYIDDHLSSLSLRFREEQTHLLLLPRLGARIVTAEPPPTPLR